MSTKVQKWGNSQGLRVTKALLDEAGIHVGDEPHPPCLLLSLRLPALLGFPPFGRRGLALLADRRGAGA